MPVGYCWTVDPMPSILRPLPLFLVFLLAGSGTGFAQGPSPLVSTGLVGATSPIEVWGHERLGWDQAEADAAGLAELTFTSSVDGYRELLEDVRCAPLLDRFGFGCSSRLPRMAVGPHTIQLSAARGPTEISGLSDPLMVVFRSRTLESASVSNSARLAGLLDAEQLVGALVEVADIAALPDGTVLIGEERGRILATRPGESPAIAVDLRTLDRSLERVVLLALAVAPDFLESHAIFAAYTARGGLRLVRFTEANGILLNQAVLRESLPIALASPRAALAVGPDNKMYLAVADQVLRLNLDGSTPEDGPASGVFAAGVLQARSNRMELRAASDVAARLDR